MPVNCRKRSPRDQIRGMRSDQARCFLAKSDTGGSISNNEDKVRFAHCSDFPPWNQVNTRAIRTSSLFFRE